SPLAVASPREAIRAASATSEAYAARSSWTAAVLMGADASMDAQIDVNSSRYESIRQISIPVNAGKTPRHRGPETTAADQRVRVVLSLSVAFGCQNLNSTHE